MKQWKKQCSWWVKRYNSGYLNQKHPLNALITILMRFCFLGSIAGRLWKRFHNKINSQDKVLISCPSLMITVCFVALRTNEYVTYAVSEWCAAYKKPITTIKTVYSVKPARNHTFVKLNSCSVPFFCWVFKDKTQLYGQIYLFTS